MYLALVYPLEWFCRWGSGGAGMGRNPKTLSFVYGTIENSFLSLCAVCLVFLPPLFSLILTSDTCVKNWVAEGTGIDVVKKVNLLIQFFRDSLQE